MFTDHSFWIDFFVYLDDDGLITKCTRPQIINFIDFKYKLEKEETYGNRREVYFMLYVWF